ncbi:hypothetical protein UlMin_011192 [Ulmus minor]
MESPRVIPKAQSLSPSSSGRRYSTDSNSPEFEFWMLRNPSFPQPQILSADELFVDGVLLPLSLLPQIPHPHSDLPPQDPQVPKSEPSPPDPEPEPGPGPEISSSTASLSASKRWRDIFKKGDKKNAKKETEDRDKEKRKDRKSGTGSSSAELNINIWPFSRSRSAGNASTRPKMVFGAPGARKVNSAPCSRSNSTGETKSRKCPTSPGRAGVHLGRSSPVWQVRRGGSGQKSFEPPARNAEKGTKKEASETRRSKVPSTPAAVAGGGAKAKVLNLNVPMCIGYRTHLGCRSDENSTLGVGGRVAGGGGENRRGGRGSSGGVDSAGNMFNLRSLFTKKVH